MTLVEWINTPGALEAYREWQANPVTKIMIDGIDQTRLVSKMHTPTAEKALQEVGFRAGKDQDIVLLTKLDDYIVETGSPVTDAQIRYLVETEGYSEEEAKDIVTKQGA